MATPSIFEGLTQLTYGEARAGILAGRLRIVAYVWQFDREGNESIRYLPNKAVTSPKLSKDTVVYVRAIN